MLFPAMIVVGAYVQVRSVNSGRGVESRGWYRKLALKVEFLCASPNRSHN